MFLYSLRKQSNFLQIDSVNCFLHDQHNNERNRKNIFLSKEGSSLDKRITNNKIYSKNHSFNVQKVFLKTNISLLLIRIRVYAYQGARNIGFRKNLPLLLMDDPS